MFYCCFHVMSPSSLQIWLMTTCQPWAFWKIQHGCRWGYLMAIATFFGSITASISDSKSSVTTYGLKLGEKKAPSIVMNERIVIWRPFWPPSWILQNAQRLQSVINRFCNLGVPEISKQAKTVVWYEKQGWDVILPDYLVRGSQVMIVQGKGGGFM